MRFKFVNPHNVRWLCPSWALDAFVVAQQLEQALATYRKNGRRFECVSTLSFWVEIEIDDAGGATFRLAEWEDGVDRMYCGRMFITSREWQINLPLNDMLCGIPKLDGMHTLYLHSFSLSVPLGYFGITKRPWYVRFAQHEASARAGSPYLFHRAIREHAGVQRVHMIVLAGIDHEMAMKQEEEMVSIGTLYPLGLNMIPGGMAGLRYLSSIGVHAKNAAERDDALETLSSRVDIGGRPNPLCAARWESDQDFVNRVICGHSGRLTVEEVRRVRLLTSFGEKAERVACRLGLSSRRISSVLSGRTYSRVA